MGDNKYVVGIDLGTTNCVVSFMDKSLSEQGGRILGIPQFTNRDVIEPVEGLPSFIYIPLENELPSPMPVGMEGSIITGIYARERGALLPGRLISSAKSWLCHPEVDKKSPILPWAGQDSIQKLSPIEASSILLRHIAAAWDKAMGQQYPLNEQDIFITVPASFDAAAREFTVEAARKAGLDRHTLLEEPQAAFYSWLYGKSDEWRKELTVGDLILVIDIGGGTTDLSLIAVSEEDGELVLDRVAIGDHLLLGGDNIDLALAHHLNKKFLTAGTKLNSVQMLELIHRCRAAKEVLLGGNVQDSLTVTIMGSGRSVIGGSVSVELTLEEVSQVVLDGFFPVCSVSDSPISGKSSGFKELGLQYSSDPAVTRHIARFLTHHAVSNDKGFVHPTKILFNGGVTKASAVCTRIMEVLNGWLSGDGAAALSGNDVDKAVAIGAAYYGLVKSGKGIRIRGGAGRTYYIGIESSMPAVPGMPPPLKALTVAGFGMEEGTDIRLSDKEFGVVVGREAEFRLLSSTVRKDDLPGTIIGEWDDGEIVESAPLVVTLPVVDGGEAALSVVPVILHIYLTEVGTLEIYCERRDGSHRWRLQFEVRGEPV